MKRSGPLRRRTPLRAVSPKRRSEQAARAAVIEATHARSGWRCELADLVPSVACAGRLDCDEIAPRSALIGGHLDLANTQSVCRAHHDWKHAHPREAAALGARRWSWEAS